MTVMICNFIHCFDINMQFKTFTLLLFEKQYLKSSKNKGYF